MSLFSKLLDLSKSADQSGEMMGALGVDLGPVPDEDKGRTFRRIAQRCAQCEKPEECRGWLDSNPVADAPPSYCRNADLFARLRDATSV